MLTARAEARALAFGEWKSNPSEGLGFSRGISDVQVPDIQRVFFDEFAPRFDLVAHEGREHLVGFGVVFRFGPK